MDKWISKSLYQHPAPQHKGIYGRVCLNDHVGTKDRGTFIYYFLVSGCRMTCPQDWASRIHVEENINLLVEDIEGLRAEVEACPAQDIIHPHKIPDGQEAIKL